MEEISFLTLILAWSAQISESIFYVLTPVTLKYRSLTPIIELDLAPPGINILCKMAILRPFFWILEHMHRQCPRGWPLTLTRGQKQMCHTNVLNKSNVHVYDEGCTIIGLCVGGC